LLIYTERELVKKTLAFGLTVSTDIEFLR